MPKHVALTICLLIALFAVSAEAACKVCFPGCKDAARAVEGKTSCRETAGSCTLTGLPCTGSGTGDCECGTVRCDPCNPVCAPQLSEWEVAEMKTSAPASPEEWQLISVVAEPAASRPGEKRS
jgi:hypothetical protein